MQRMPARRAVAPRAARTPLKVLAYVGATEHKPVPYKELAVGASWGV